jgi:hypothetical protein
MPAFCVLADLPESSQDDALQSDEPAIRQTRCLKKAFASE